MCVPKRLLQQLTANWGSINYLIHSPFSLHWKYRVACLPLFFGYHKRKFYFRNSRKTSGVFLVLFAYPFTSTFLSPIRWVLTKGVGGRSLHEVQSKNVSGWNHWLFQLFTQFNWSTTLTTVLPNCNNPRHI